MDHVVAAGVSVLVVFLALVLLVVWAVMRGARKHEEAVETADVDSVRPFDRRLTRLSDAA